jgi:protein-arginine kinase activator protein McsA
MKNQLAISSTLSLPIDAVTQKLAMLGRTGSGKTYGSTKLAELMLDAGAQVVALDPVGVWYGLRTAYSIPVFGGLHGDIPLEVGGGALIADLIVDRRISCVVDVSQFESDADKARFARDFAARFYFRQKSSPSPVHLFLEEAQEFVPQNPEKEEGRMLHAFVRIAKLGRNFGIGMTQLSQRPQEVNKKALNQTECLFAFQMTGPQERKAIAAWATSKGVDEDLDEILPGLEVGQARVWSPQWLRISQTIKIAQKKSADVSSTPKHGAKRIKPKDLQPVDLESLREKMSATIERAKSENPAALRAEIAALKRELSKKQPSIASVDKPAKPPKRVEVQIVKAKEVAALESSAKRITDAGDKFVQLGEKLLGILQDAHAATNVGPGAKIVFERGTAAVRQPFQHKAAIEGAHNDLHRKLARPSQPTKPAPPVDGAFQPNGPQTRILNTLLTFETLGVVECDRNQVALFSDASPTSSTYGNNVSGLNVAGLIEYPSKGRIRLTEAGRAIAVPEAVFNSIEELHQTWTRKLGPTVGKLLEVLIEAYPEPITRHALAEAVVAAGGKASPTSSTFGNNVSTLSALGLVSYPSKGLVVATKLLFPPI